MYILVRGFNLLDQLLKSPCKIPWWLWMRRPLSESLHAVRVMLAALCCMITAEVQMLLQMLLCDSKEEVSPGLGGSGYVPLNHLPRMASPRNLLCVFFIEWFGAEQLSTPTQIDHIFQPHLSVHYLFTVVPPFLWFSLLAIFITCGHQIFQK